MLFYTVEFLVLFISLLLLFALFRRTQQRKILLLIASYIFYMWWNPAFILLIMFSTAVDFVIGSRIPRAESQRRKRLLLVISLVSNLGLLAFFKYANFLQDNMLFLFRLFGYEPGWSTLNIILPVGISFYTFQTLSYTLDVYRGNLKTEKSPLDFALFVAFFPQLVAGPIVRASDFLPQLKSERPLCIDRVAVMIFLRGLAKKVLIADNVAPLANMVFADPASHTSIAIWLATLCFSVQIYCDFSGYSDMAISIARCFGYHLPVNFRRPYFAVNPSDFWQRWHISLSSWLRDYLYIPLGGNRGGSVRTYKNLMLTMLLGGLWHGASWNFVLWGFLHGLVLIIHRVWRYFVKATRFDAVLCNIPLAIRTLISWGAMQYWVLLTWIAFRVGETDQMLIAIKKFVFIDFALPSASQGLGHVIFYCTFVLGIFGMIHMVSHFREGLDGLLVRCSDRTAYVIAVIIGCLLMILWPLAETPFVYFQF